MKISWLRSLIGSKGSAEPIDIKLSAPVKGRPLRIVHVDDEPAVLGAVRVIIQHRLKRIELLQFQHSVTACRALERLQTDLLIPDDCMPLLRGSDIVQRLAEIKATCPIIVISAWEQTQDWVDDFARRGMRISYLAAPFEIKTFFEHVSRHVGLLGQ